MHHMDDDAQSDDGKLKSPFGSAFRTFDSQDYSNIGKVITDNMSDSFIATLVTCLTYI